MSKQVIQQLRNGILPPKLNFNLDNQTKDIDWTKVQYNTFYKNLIIYYHPALSGL